MHHLSSGALPAQATGHVVAYRWGAATLVSCLSGRTHFHSHQWTWRCSTGSRGDRFSGGGQLGASGLVRESVAGVVRSPHSAKKGPAPSVRCSSGRWHGAPAEPRTSEKESAAKRSYYRAQQLCQPCDAEGGEGPHGFLKPRFTKRDRNCIFRTWSRSRIPVIAAQPRSSYTTHQRDNENCSFLGKGV